MIDMEEEGEGEEFLGDKNGFFFFFFLNLIILLFPIITNLT